MRLLLDTHFLLWVVTGSRRLREHAWVLDQGALGVSPVSLLELQFLHEVGRIRLDNPAFSEAVASDARFVIDEAPMLPLFQRAVALSWTRDPFDRLLCAHSELRRVPLCSLDRGIQQHHRLLPRQLAT